MNIVATGAGKQSDINIIGSDVSGKQGTSLKADNDINLLAAEQTHLERSTNKSSGFNAGATNEKTIHYILFHNIRVLLS